MRFPAERLENRIPVAEKSISNQGFFGEIVSGSRWDYPETA
jgi:hypothetical protein